MLSVSCTHQNTNYRASYRLTPPLVISSWKPQNEKSLYSLVGETEGGRADQVIVKETSKGAEATGGEDPHPEDAGNDL